MEWSQPLPRKRPLNATPAQAQAQAQAKAQARLDAAPSPLLPDALPQPATPPSLAGPSHSHAPEHAFAAVLPRLSGTVRNRDGAAAAAAAARRESTAAFLPSPTAAAAPAWKAPRFAPAPPPAKPRFDTPRVQPVATALRAALDARQHAMSGAILRQLTERRYGERTPGSVLRETGLGLAVRRARVEHPHEPARRDAQALLDVWGPKDSRLRGGGRGRTQRRGGRRRSTQRRRRSGA